MKIETRIVSYLRYTITKKCIENIFRFVLQYHQLIKKRQKYKFRLIRKNKQLIIHVLQLKKKKNQRIKKKIKIECNMSLHQDIYTFVNLFLFFDS